MDYEKAYKEALEKARKLCTYPTTNFQSDLEDIFPELKVKESEDERIRKWLIGYFQQYRIDGMEVVYTSGFKVNDIISWLEKQGEQKPAIEMKSAEESLGIDSATYNKIVDEVIYGEQKPIDKVKPKFHEGDWIIYEYKGLREILKVTAPPDNEYICENLNGENRYLYNENAEEYKFWTINDIKPSDVIVWKENHELTCIALIKNITYSYLKNEGNVELWFSYYTDGSWKAWNETSSFTNVSSLIAYNAKPANKRERDLLFKKMRDAGYEWDAEKKEVRKIERKITESEGKKIRKAIIKFLIDVNNGAYTKSELEIASWIAWLEKQGEYKSPEEVLKIRQELYQSGYNDGYKHGCEDTKKQGDTNEPINRNEFAQGVLRGAAINLITWIDYNAAEGNTCLSNVQCKDIENALVKGDWDKIYGYMKKKLEKQGEKEKVDANETNNKHQDVMQMLQSIYEVLVSINNKNTPVQIVPYTHPPLEPFYDTSKPYCNTINKIEDEKSETNM